MPSRSTPAAAAPDRTRTYRVATVAAFAVGATAFGLLTDGAAEGGDLSAYDPQVLDDMVAARSPSLTPIFQTLTTIGSLPVVVTMTALVIAGLAWRRAWSQAAFVAVAMAGSAALTVGLKALVARHRPDSSVMLDGPDPEFSFPSGHTLNSTVFLLVVVWLVLRHTDRVGVRALTIAAAAALAVGIGVSRLYLGYHWMTDVLAGWVLAPTWVALLTLLPRWSWWSARPAAPEAKTIER
jgi:undecaprenyl-diphosphatase